MKLSLRAERTESELAGSVAAVALLGVWAEVHYATSPIPNPVGAYAFTVAAAAVMLYRRRLPIATGVLCLVLCYGYRAAGYPGFAPAMLVFLVCYTLATMRGLLYGIAPAVPAWIIPALPPHALSLFGAGVAMPPVGMVMTALIGESQRRRRIEYEARLRESALAAEARWGQRTAQERLRIARELHDVLAHTISVIAVQSGVALDSLDEGTEAVRESLLAVRAAARQAMPELRAALDMLRSENARPDDEAAHSPPKPSPQPGFAEIPELLEQARASGSSVDLTMAPDAWPVGASALIQLTAYRVVQESLTNVRKHASAAHTHVTLQRTGDTLAIDVIDDGRGSSPPEGRAPRSGLGLLGMRERVESLGGRLTTGPLPGGGFRVRATLPWNAAPDTGQDGAA